MVYQTYNTITNLPAAAAGQMEGPLASAEQAGAGSVSGNRTDLMDMDLHDWQQVRQRFDQLLEYGSSFVLRLKHFSEGDEAVLNELLQRILAVYGREGLQFTLFSCLKELITNGLKANVKRMLFDELGISGVQRQEYLQGMAEYKKRFNQGWFQKYAQKAGDAGLFVEIRFFHDADGVRIEVVNNIDILPEDEKRVRSKFSRGMTYDNLGSFYLDHGDSTEGEGLGFALSVLLLRGQQINPALFRVGSHNGETFARLEIPFTENFRSVRGRKPDGYTTV